MPNHDIHEVLAQRLRSFQSGVPATEHYRQIRADTLYHSADLDGAEDHWPRQQRYAEATAITDFVGDRSPIIRVEHAIDDSRFESGFPQSSGQAEEPKWRTKNRSGIWRQEQKNLAGTRHVNVSRRWARPRFLRPSTHGLVRFAVYSRLQPMPAGIAKDSSNSSAE